MKVYLGKTGLGNSWQEPFPETTKCHKCDGKARIMFVGIEEGDVLKWVSDLRDNGGKGDYWVHDAIACAVYLCEDCFETVAILNQA